MKTPDATPAPPKPVFPPPQKMAFHWAGALFWHTVGFGILVVVLWADQIFKLQYHLFGGQMQDINYLQVSSASGIILVLWMFSAYKIYQVVSRLTYLESFHHVCSWCQKIAVEDNWISVDKYLAEQTGGKTSHGICPACAEKFQRDFQKMAASLQASGGNPPATPGEPRMG